MIVRQRPRAVVLGRMTTMPFGGVLWQNLHYLVGLERLGFETFYVEAHAVAPRHFSRGPEDDGGAAAAAFLDRLLSRFGFGGRWAFHALDHDGRCYGMSLAALETLYASAEVLINLHGGTRPRPEHVASRRLVCVVTDPVQMEVELDRAVPDTVRFFEAHDTVFTFGELYGRPGCRLPVSDRFPIHATRQPVVLDFWNGGEGPPPEAFTTIANWQQRRGIRIAGETYEWSKNLEFEKVIDLPSRTSRPLELALSRCPEADRQRLAGHGWRVVDALTFSSDLDAYRRYVETSRAEFTVAKDQNVRLRTGWFSDRSATYLAAGRPVVTQDTGFGETLPAGEGLFAFASAEEAAAAIAAIDADYPRHRRAAREIARACFAHDVVLRPLLETAGIEVPRPGRRAPRDGALRVMLVAHRFPPDAVGGVERYTEKLVEGLVAAGDEVSVVARRPGEGPLRREVERLASGVPVHRLRGGAVRRDRFLAGRAPLEELFLEALLESEPDVVHVNHLLDLSPGILRIARERGAAVVLTLHDYYFACQRIILRTPGEGNCAGPEGGRACARGCFAGENGGAASRWPLRTVYFRHLLGLADRIVCPSPFVASFFERFGAAPDRLRVVSNGVWVDRTSPPGLGSESWATPRERGRLALAFLGAVLPHKGLGVVLEALAEARLAAVDLTVCGPVADPAWARGLCARAEEIPGLRLRFYGEYETDEVPLLLDDVDCVLAPSQWPETFCLVAHEALARGVPVAVSRMGALPDWVVDGRNGFVFDHDRPGQLAAALRRLVDEPELLERLRAGARATAVPTIAGHVAELRATYRDALRRAGEEPAPDVTELDEIDALESALEGLGFGDPLPTLERT